MRKNFLLIGTLILTAAGFVSRFIGFFYRIFLSRMFSSESMGIYELINPVLALTYALCTSGIQNAISKFSASQIGPSKKIQQLRILLTGLFFSGFLSVGCSFFVYHFSDFIARNLLMEERCAPLLRIVALSFPAACVHSCINGYYYGIRKTGLPAFCQLLEQIFRVGSVFMFWFYSEKYNITFSINAAAVGLVIGEIVSALFSLTLTWWHFAKDWLVVQNSFSPSALSTQKHLGLSACASELLHFAAPLSLNRISLNLLSTVEAAWIPAKLEQYGHTASQALSIYGVLTGMAMTCIFFPGAITNSISVLLMPMIAQADASKDYASIRKILKKCVCFCLAMGIGCMLLFISFGEYLGILLFDSTTAGHFIRTLSLLCPVLYLNSTLYSIQNGLGRTGLTFTCSLCALCIRLLFVFFMIPVFGISGYLWGLLTSQLFITLFHTFTLKHFLTHAKLSTPST